ncbi:unnamed protein product [Arabis nemorensis]|uniref:RBR-type E3 ubiquitin transferase n=1 Tax=Arabis nemorensis TaxID=586526 RepID=A0A565CSV6_9BRAS|nr:unnamed protein product [Arabis nemorensis]
MGQLHHDYMACMDAGVRRRITLLAKATKKESCVICLDDDIDSDLMFLVGRCVHRFCFNCVRKHIQVTLLDGKIPDCPKHRCKTKLSIDRCNELLTPKLLLMWEQRIEEDSLPLSERVYCPYISCYYLMSKTDLSSSVEFGLRRCMKCRGFFCVDCKVPWHSRLLCTDYKKLQPDPQNDNNDVKLKSLAKLKGWRQCSKCQHMVERTCGCKHMTCKCGNHFCYELNGTARPILTA